MPHGGATTTGPPLGVSGDIEPLWVRRTRTRRSPTSAICLWARRSGGARVYRGKGGVDGKRQTAGSLTATPDGSLGWLDGKKPFSRFLAQPTTNQMSAGGSARVLLPTGACFAFGPSQWSSATGIWDKGQIHSLATYVWRLATAVSWPKASSRAIDLDALSSPITPRPGCRT